MAIPNHFDRGKPFYPLVTNYLLLLAGWKEIAGSRLPGIRRTLSFDPEQFDVSDAAKLAELKSGIAKALGPLELKCESHPTRISIDIDLLASEVATNSGYLASFLMRAAGALLVLAHEGAKEEPYHDTGELWEFLRHCRNAAAHGGRFTFVGPEPRRQARWSSLEIARSLEGIPLFKNDQGIGYLSPGDPIRLLWDIEQAYPKMAAT
jgi:hypothetical protein